MDYIKNFPHNSLDEILLIAEHLTKKRAFKFWFVARIMLPAKRAKFIFLAHAYLRWVDDYIDDPKNNIKEKEKFIDKELGLINSLSKKLKPEIQKQEEYFLYYYIEYALKINNKNLINELRSIAESVELDLRRLQKDGVFSSKELQFYIDKQAKSLFLLIYYFLIPGVVIKNRDETIGQFLWNILSLRDFIEDYSSGYINICREEIERYNLDTNNLRDDEKRFIWMEEKYKELLELLKREVIILNNMPLKVKLFWWAAYPSLIFELIRIKNYNYYFGEKRKRIFFTEIKISLEAFLLSCKTVFKIYF